MAAAASVTDVACHVKKSQEGLRPGFSPLAHRSTWSRLVGPRFRRNSGADLLRRWRPADQNAGVNRLANFPFRHARVAEHLLVVFAAKCRCIAHSELVVGKAPRITMDQIRAA